MNPARASPSSTAGSRPETGPCPSPSSFSRPASAVLTIDVRGHGANPSETLPISAGEFGTDAHAAFEALIARPEVTVGGIAGHSLGGIGALLAGAADARVAAVVATSAPAEPNQLTRLTFRLANLPIPDPVAMPLAWLTTRVYLRPRGHRVGNVSASAALATTDEPVLLIHGAADEVVPPAHLGRLLAAAERSGRPVESLIVAEGRHSWLHEFELYRRTVAAFLARSLGGPYRRRKPQTAPRRYPDFGSSSRRRRSALSPPSRAA